MRVKLHKYSFFNSIWPKDYVDPFRPYTLYIAWVIIKYAYFLFSSNNTKNLLMSYLYNNIIR